MDKGWVVHDGEPLAAAVHHPAQQVGSVVIPTNRNVDAHRAPADGGVGGTERSA